MPLESSSDWVADDRWEWQRYPAHFDIALKVTADGQKRRCLVRDISLGGARLYCEDGLPDTTEIMLQHPLAGRVSAERLWRKEKEVGIRFDFSEAALTMTRYPLPRTTPMQKARRPRLNESLAIGTLGMTDGGAVGKWASNRRPT